MVRIVAALGVPPVAKPFLWEHRGKHDFNPEGFYDSKLFDILRAKPGQGCMKVWGAGVAMLPRGVASHIIMCKREPHAAIESHVRWLRRCHWPFPRTVARWINGCHAEVAMPCGIPVLVVELEELKKDVLGVVSKIARFIDAPTDTSALRNAAAMVRS